MKIKHYLYSAVVILITIIICYTYYKTESLSEYVFSNSAPTVILNNKTGDIYILNDKKIKKYTNPDNE